jgi:hypothetical protein
MTLKAGWLNRQLDKVEKDVQEWPDWMKREAAFAPSVAPGPSKEYAEEPEGRRTIKAGAEGNAQG